MESAFVTHRFILDQPYKEKILQLEPAFGFNGFGDAVFYRTYSRKIPSKLEALPGKASSLLGGGDQESWANTVLRVTEGIFSLRKDHFIKHYLPWKDADWQEYAFAFAQSMFKMYFLPPGRGLWACGTEFCYQRGSASLNNCGACTMKDFTFGATWMFDMLMNGCGIGADTEWDGHLCYPNKNSVFRYQILDSREGWVESLRLLLQAYIPENSSSKLPDLPGKSGNLFEKTGPFPSFDYSLIRPKGAVIRGFGGTSSGPDPLIKLHQRVEIFLDTYYLFKERQEERAFELLVQRLVPLDYQWMEDREIEKLITSVKQAYRENPEKKRYDATRCTVDILNAIGACVVAGNIRRSAELIIGRPNDQTFLHLKDYRINPERQSIGWMSNNTVRLQEKADFSLIPSIAERIRDNGEPGVFNQLNVERYGRVGRYYHPNDPWTREHESDRATLCNPCITGDTPILTSKGWIPVNDLVDQPFQAIVDGKEYSSKGFWSTGRQRVFLLKLENGSILKATGNHQIYTSRGKVEVSSLIPGEDQVILLNNSALKVEGEVTNFDEGYLCGQIIENGSYLTNSIQFRVNRKDYPEGDSLEDYPPYQRLNAAIKSLDLKAEFNLGEDLIRVSLDFTPLFEKHPEMLEGRIPEDQSTLFAQGLLVALLDAQGFVNDDEIRVGSNLRSGLLPIVGEDRNLLQHLETLQRLLSRFGIMSRIKWEYSFVLVIKKEELIIKLIRFNQTDDLGFFLHSRSSKYFSLVELIQLLGEEEVFDCTVDEIHAFNANGMKISNCSEIPLEPFELCNLAEIFPPRCIADAPDESYPGRISPEAEKLFNQALEFATFYSSTVSLLPTHWEITNQVIARNRRIGVSLSGVADLYDRIGFTELTRICRAGYKIVRQTNTRLANEAGIPPAIRVTTIKPSGCQSKETLVVTNKGILSLEEIGSPAVLAEDSPDYLQHEQLDLLQSPEWQDHHYFVTSETTGKVKESTRFYRNGREKTKIIKMKSGLSLESTFNHRYRAFQQGKLVWISADKLQVGDCLPYRIGDYLDVEEKDYYPLKKITIVRPLIGLRKMTITQPDYLDENLAWFIGYLGPDKSLHRIRKSLDELDQLEKGKTIQKLFSLDDRIGRRKIETFNRNLRAELIHQWLDANLKLKAIEIPRIIRQSSSKIIQAYLNGYWIASGCESLLSEKNYLTLSKKMAYEIVILLRAIGKSALLREKIISEKETTYWIQETTFSADDLCDQLDDCGYPRLFPDFIESITEGETETFDLEVPDGNTYIANSYISHNSISQLVGVSSGMHFPTFQYAIRRMRVADDSPIAPVLIQAGYPWEKDSYSDNTLVFEFPIDQGKTRIATKVSMWEQFALLTTAQREFSDNMVSVTIYYNPENEAHQLEYALAQHVPMIKSVSILPHTEEGAYKQMPYQGITLEEYQRRLGQLKPINWAQYGGSDGQMPKFCNNEICEL